MELIEYVNLARSPNLATLLHGRKRLIPFPVGSCDERIELPELTPIQVGPAACKISYGLKQDILKRLAVEIGPDPRASYQERWEALRMRVAEATA